MQSCAFVHRYNIYDKDDQCIGRFWKNDLGEVDQDNIDLNEMELLLLKMASGEKVYVDYFLTENDYE